MRHSVASLELSRLKHEQESDKQRLVNRRVYGGFGGLVLLLLVLLSVAFQSFGQLAEANRWNIHSYQVLGEIRGLTSSLFYLKRDARNFVNQRNAKLIAELRVDKADFRDNLLQTSTVTADSPQHQARLRKINELYLRWLDDYLEPLLLGQTPDKDAGKRHMDAMRALLKDMKQAESDLLDYRAARAAELQKRTTITLLLGGGFAILVAITLSTLLAKSAGELERTNQRLEREGAERARAQDELAKLHQDLQQAHDELDERVRQRTDELEKSREHLRALAGHIELVREEERTRMARDIHDQLGQAMTGLKMDALWLHNHLPKPVATVGLGGPAGVARSDGNESRRKIEAMMRLIDGTIHLVGKIASDLRPAILDDLGLVAAIEWQAGEFEERSGVSCTFEALADDDHLPPDVATGAFRIMQEALTNVARHAGATQVKIVLAENQSDLILTIADNGRGLQGPPRDPKSLGLMGMRERALLLGGTITVEGAAGEGTTVTLRVPLSSAEKPAAPNASAATV